MARVGTLEWARAGGGRLSAKDRLTLLGQGVAYQASDAAAMLGLRGRGKGRLDFEAVRVPDTRAAKEAEELCDGLRPEMLVNHSYRTYLWANFFAQREGLKFDEEVVYVSSLLHDLGLAHNHRSENPPCFTLLGADAAQRCGKAGDWSDERADAAAEAITLHMNARLDGEVAEARIMAAGTLLDAMGARYREVDPATVHEIFKRYPRGDVEPNMVELFQWQAEHNKGARAHFYWRYVGLKGRLKKTPFNKGSTT